MGMPLNGALDDVIYQVLDIKWLGTENTLLKQIVRGSSFFFDKFMTEY